MKFLDKNTLLSIFIGLAFVAIIARFVPPYVKPVLKLELHKNQVAITRLNQPREITDSRTQWVDRLDLHHRNGFAHPKLGPLGWNENFFVDLDSTFSLAEAGNYRFVVGSDDGFSLSLDGRELCRHLRDRPYRRQSCHVSLDAGEHRLQLRYFQGYGQAGLTLEFGPTAANGKLRFWGEHIEGVAYLTGN